MMFSLFMVSEHCFRNRTIPFPGNYRLNTTP
jgi:hypothetical protein